MSFSADTKQSLCANDLEASCCIISELAAFISACGSLVFRGLGKYAVDIKLDLANIAKRVYVDLKQIGISPEMRRIASPHFGGRYYYSLQISSQNARFLLQNLGIINDNNELISMGPKYYPSRTCCRKSYLRACFLALGSIQNPSSQYHLELSTQNEVLAKNIIRLAKHFNIIFKELKRKDKYVLYLKSSDEISKFLACIGASKAFMQLEDTKIKKSILNSINRAMNCDSANINKQLRAAKEQIEQIRYLQSKNIPIDEGLVQIVNLRLNNPELSLEQLGTLHEPKLSKSGVYYKINAVKDLYKKTKNSIN